MSVSGFSVSISETNRTVSGCQDYCELHGGTLVSIMYTNKIVYYSTTLLNDHRAEIHFKKSVYQLHRAMIVTAPAGAEIHSRLGVEINLKFLQNLMHLS